MAGEPQAVRGSRSGWSRRWYHWWPPAAAFLAVLIGVPAIVLGAAYAVAGGSDQYALEPTRSCLAKVDGLRVSKNDGELNDFIAESAVNGAVRIWFPANQVAISFGGSDQDAERTARAYARFSGSTINVKDLLRQEHNAVMLWADVPSQEDEKTISDCLG
jgi:hypothetical protein